VSAKITDNRSFDLEVDGKKVKVTLADLQSLYDQIHVIPGIRQHGYHYPSYPWTRPYVYSNTGFVNSNTEAAQITLKEIT